MTSRRRPHTTERRHDDGLERPTQGEATRHVLGNLFSGANPKQKRRIRCCTGNMRGEERTRDGDIKGGDRRSESVVGDDEVHLGAGARTRAEPLSGGDMKTEFRLRRVGDETNDSIMPPDAIRSDATTKLMKSM